MVSDHPGSSNSTKATEIFASQLILNACFFEAQLNKLSVNEDADPFVGQRPWFR